jgi:cytochrome P450
MENFNQVLVFTLKVMNSGTALIDKNNPSIDGKDMLSRWLTMHATNPQRMSKEDIIITLPGNIFASFDTTAITLHSIFYYLITNPSCMQTLIQEINNKYRFSRIVTYQENKEHFPYLNVVIKEALRIHPVVGIFLKRYVPKG